ncbi:MAG TPA: DUF3040 domain-containing protein [Actinomycetota bacterium]|nr:DUF3040 domain-containing protein [Actinomycetota bacterium]
MPLSDREQQILQEIEDQLYEQDPEFARGVSATTLQAHLLRNVRRGIAAFVAGFVVLVLFFFNTHLLVGVAAFLLMLAGAVYTYDNLRKIGSEQLRVLREQAPFADFLSRIRSRMRDMGNREGS